MPLSDTFEPMNDILMTLSDPYAIGTWAWADYNHGCNRYRINVSVLYDRQNKFYQPRFLVVRPYGTRVSCVIGFCSGYTNIIINVLE